MLAIASSVLPPGLAGPFGSINVAFYISANDVSSARLLRSIACLSLLVPVQYFFFMFSLVPPFAFDYFNTIPVFVLSSCLFGSVHIRCLILDHT